MYKEFQEHVIAINPDKLSEKINCLNDYFKGVLTDYEIIIEFELPLKQWKKNIHFIKIKANPQVINNFIEYEFLKQNGD